jgi:DtxR family Mn-dependent transcriptional regulator
MAYESTEHHPAFEEYSETIFELEEDGIGVIQARIAERLEVSRPAVSEMIKRMSAEGLVVTTDDGSISLTDDGRSLATTMVRRHRIAERFLTDVLKLGWADAHHEAGKWEHVISPVVEEAMMQILEDPTTCPHGNPIPGTDYSYPDSARPLSEIGVEQEFTIERIPEELEFEEGQLTYLEQAGLIPGCVARVVSAAPDGTLTVMVDQKATGISQFAASRIIVRDLATTGA